MCIPGSSLQQYSHLRLSSWVGGALNILPSPFRWSWALVEFRWIRRRLDCARFGRSLIEAVHFCGLNISTHPTPPPPTHITNYCTGLSAASIRYHLVAPSNNTDYIAPTCVQQHPLTATARRPGVAALLTTHSTLARITGSLLARHRLFCPPALDVRR